MAGGRETASHMAENTLERCHFRTENELQDKVGFFLFVCFLKKRYSKQGNSKFRERICLYVKRTENVGINN